MQHPLPIGKKSNYHGSGSNRLGKWTRQNTLDLGVSLPIITESVFARFISSIKEERIAASKLLKGLELKKYASDPNDLIEAIRKALCMSKFFSYAQGFAHMRVASEDCYGEIPYGEVAMIFRRGCIIRS